MVIRVVKVAFCGKDRLSLSSSPQAKTFCKPPGANLGASGNKITVNSRKTFIEVVTDYRIDFAMQELVHTNKPITQIGFESGFNDISNFYKTFKERRQLSPLAYRNMFVNNL